jgi:phosphoribosylanthranilate isomerase
MSGPAIKICGITNPQALDAAIEARADYVGLNFFPPSPRHISHDIAAALAARAEGRIIRVGVFVDPGDDLLYDAIGAGRLNAVQLHRVTAARRAAIMEHFRLPVWAVVEVSKPADLAARGHLEAADRVIYDAKTPKNAALPGGMGLVFDWSLLSGLSHPWPWGLAGGLTPDNVAEAIHLTGAPLVDTSSGVESAPGVKDVDKIAAFCKAARIT